MTKRAFLFQNIVGAEYIVCTHCLNIVGASAPTAPMVPTPMIFSEICKGKENKTDLR